MAKKKKRSRRKFTVPISVVAGLGAGLLKPAQAIMAGDYPGALNWLAYSYAGIGGALTDNPHFAPEGLKFGVLPLVVGALVHKFVGGSLGVNRTLAAAGVPFIRI